MAKRKPVSVPVNEVAQQAPEVAAPPTRLQRIESWLDSHRLVVGIAIVVGLFLLYESNHSTINGGDTRGLVDLSYWIVHSDQWSLNGHPLYGGDGPGWGYWAVKTEDGKIATVYPPGILLFSSPCFVLGDWCKLSPDAIKAPRAGKFTSALLIALSCGLFWYTAARQSGATAALIGVVFLGLASPYWGALSQALWSQNGAVLAQALSCAFIAPCIRVPRLSRLQSWLMGAAAFFAAWAPFCRPTFAVWTVLFVGWIAWEHRLRAWPAVIGSTLGLGLGLGLNQLTTGSLAGLYVAKQTGEAGFDFHPGAMLTALRGLLVSPGRGLFLFCPWTLLVIAALAWLAKRRQWRHDAWLCLHAAFVLVILGSLVAFKVWFGGASPGPRLPADALFSAGLLVCAHLRPLLHKSCVLPLLALLAAPSIFLQYRIAQMSDYMIDNVAQVDAARVNEYHASWRTSALRWYVTKGAPLRELISAPDDCTMREARLSADGPQPSRFIEAEAVVGQTRKGANFFHSLGPNPAWRFVPPPAIADKDLVAVLSLIASEAPGHAHKLSIEVNGTRVAKFEYVEGAEKASQGVRIPQGTLRSGSVNTISLRDSSPAFGKYGRTYCHLLAIDFVPPAQVPPNVRMNK